MKSEYVALSVIFSAVLVGVSIPLIQQDVGGFETPNFSAETLNQAFDRQEKNSSSKNDTELVYGTAHRHALFHVVVNGSEKDFTDRKFQLNSKFVHLENNRSSIVHSHSKDVTWKKFLETINTSIRQNKSDFCIEIYGNRSCGEGSIVLNGEKNTDLETKIEQGDSFLVVLQSENINSIIKEYMKKQLPRLYKRSRDRGYRI